MRRIRKRQEHPPEGTLRRFALGRTSPAENCAVVAHLLRECGECARVICLAWAGRDEMRHLELAEIARMLASGSPFAEGCRHLAEVCPDCGDQLRQVEALLKRFRHWDPEMVVHEGLEADGLLGVLLGRDPALWSSEAEKKVEYQTWCVAWAALEKAQAKLAAEGGDKTPARHLALLAAAIAGHLGESYHSESVFDLKALAYATAAAAEPPGADSFESLRHLAAAVAALDRGTGEETVKSEVRDLLSRVLREGR